MNPLILIVNKMDGIHVQAFDFQTDRNNNTAVAFILESDLNRLRGLQPEGLEESENIEIHTLTDPDEIPYRVVSRAAHHGPHNSPAQRFSLEMVNL